MKRDFDLDRLTTGRVDQELTSVPVNQALIRARKERIRLARSGRTLRLERLCELDDSARVRANIHWLNRVLDILLDNAVEATEGLPRRSIVIGSRLRDSRGEIYVSDNGTGIPEPLHDRILSEPIEKPKGTKGLGVGLVIAQAIVHIYGGKIYWENRESGGTTMVISLPLEISPPEQRATEAP